MTTSICSSAPSPADQRVVDGPSPRFLPAPLINARAAVLNNQFCQDLSRTARKVLYGVLAFYRLGHPDQPVFAFRNKILAESLLDSRASFYRGLQEAEDKGYLRREQVRTWGARCYGQFSRSHIFLLDKALVMLGLEAPRKIQTELTECDQIVAPPGKVIEQEDHPAYLSDNFTDETLPDLTKDEIIAEWEDGRTNWEDDESGWEAGIAPQVPSPAPPCGSYPQVPCLTVRHGLLEGEPTLNHQLKGQLPVREHIPEPSSLKDFSENIDPKTRLPKDVLPLMKLGVSKTLICVLMAYAKRQGQQGALGAVVKLFWQHIEGLRGRSVFAYLRTVLNQKRDYQYLLKQQRADSIDGVLTSTATSRLSEKLAGILQRCDGFLVRNAQGKTIGTMRSNGEAGHVEGFDPERGRYAIPANARLMQAIEEGRMHLRQC